MKTFSEEGDVLSEKWWQVCPDLLQVSSLSSKPLDKIHVHFCPSGDYFFVVRDSYLREVDVICSIWAKATIYKVWLATHGIPSILRSDNCPTFMGDENKIFM